MAAQITEGILSIMSFQIFGLMLFGVIVGIIIGAIPGLSVTMGVALFLPITYKMQPIAALALIMGLYIGGTSGGLISAILLKLPGTAASVATTFDGYPMAQRGEAGKALGVGIVSSFIGGLFSYIVLMLIAPYVATFALQFGPFEYFSLALFSLLMIASLSSGSVLKGIISAALGFFFSFVGMDPLTAYPRFTLGIEELNGGFSLLPVLIGLFAVSEIIVFAEKRNVKEDSEIKQYKIKGFGFTREDVKGQGSNLLISSVIGTGIGILPGLGASVCNIISYGVAKNRSKNPEKFGTGDVGGIIASETSNNASTGGALVPLMTLGIPGDNTTAIILAGFMVHGITPGPMLFKQNAVLVYGIFAALIVCNFIMLIAEYVGMRMFVKLLSVPRSILMPAVIAFCVVGSFGVNNRLFDVGAMILFGFIGYGMKKFKLPEGPLILGIILGPILESNLRRGLMRSQGSYLPFLTEPISGIFLVITVVVLIFTIRGELRKSKRVL